MADETERVEYVFEGDVSSLRAATEQAMSLLSKYSNYVSNASNTDSFSASQRSIKSMNASINRMAKDVTKLQAKLKSVGDVKLPTGSAASKSLESTLSTLNSQMQKLNASDSITTKTLTGFKTQLEGVRSAVQTTVPQIDRLISSEQRFQNVLSAVQGGADRFRNSMESMQARISGAFDPVSNKLRSFSTIFDGVSVKIQSFKDRASTTFDRVSQLAGACASAFRRVAQSGDAADDAAATSARSHETLGDAVDTVTSEVENETQALDDEKSALKSKDSAIRKSTSSHSKLTQALGDLGRKFRSETANARAFSSALKSLQGSSDLLKKAFVALTGVTLADWLAQATTSAIAFIENLNLFSVAMGDSIEKGLQFVDVMSEVYGMDPSNLYRYSGYFYQLTDAIGMTDRASSTLSLSMTKAANDISSLFNVDIDSVVNDLASGMQGMSRAVRKYGMDIRATTLQQTALKYGITDSVQTMSEANRMALRYITMMDQVSAATSQAGTDATGASVKMGDFARTIEEPANQLRIFKEQMAQLGRAIGNFILVPLSKAIAYINGFVMALRMAINYIASLFGMISNNVDKIDTGGADNAAEAIGGIGDAAGAAAAKVKDLIAPFDELNVLQEQQPTGGGSGGGLGADILDPSLEDAIANMELGLENIRMKANEVRDKLLEFFGFKIDAGKIIEWDSSQFEANLIEKFPQWTKTIQSVFDNWKDIVEGFKKVFKSVIGVVNKVKKKILDFLGIDVSDNSIAEWIDGLSDKLDRLADWIDNHQDMLANFAIAIMVIGAAFKGWQIIQPLISTLSTLGSVLSGLLGPIAPVVGVIAGIGAALYLLYTNSTEFATSFNELLDTVWAGLLEMGEPLISLLQTIGTGILELWETSIQPTLESLGDALAPVLDTLGDLWENVSGIIAGAFELIERLWVNTLQPTFEDIFEGVQSLCDIFKELWEEVIGPVVSYIGDGIEKLWTETISPVVEKIITIIGNITQAAMGLWNNVLKPIVSWIINSLGPSIKNTFKAIWDVISQTISDIGELIDGLLTIFKGITDFLAGVFTGDWKRAWKGIVNIFVGIGNTIISAFELVINGVISLVNLGIAAIYNGVVALINLILGAVEDVAELLGFDLNIIITAPPPQIPSVNIPRIPEMATGGVVTSPTYLLAGEGNYDEAIIPLGDSPQMEELVQRIADAVDTPKPGGGGGTPIEVRVFIGGDEYDAFTFESAERGRKKVGAQPIKTGG